MIISKQKAESSQQKLKRKEIKKKKHKIRRKSKLRLYYHLKPARKNCILFLAHDAIICG